MSLLRLKHQGTDTALQLKLEQTDRDQNREFVLHTEDTSAEFELEILAEGHGRLRMHGQVIPVYAHWQNNKLQLWVEGQIYNFERVDPSAQRATGGGGSSAAQEHILAPMPGTILRVDVKEGDHFEAHAPLVIMESMKMETTLSVPHDGKVLQVLCEAGEMVEMGATLVRVAGHDESEDD
ncbi:MAG: acetyl-CoA carboxylase biotin carboxyl carrier protein subunit [Phycisphaerae bacterium]